MSMTEHGSAYSFLNGTEKAAFRKKWYYYILVPFLLFSLIICAVLFICPPLKAPYLVIWMTATGIGLVGQTISWGMLVRRHKDILESLKWEGLDTKFILPPSHFLCRLLALVGVLFLLVKQIPLSLDVMMKAPPEYTPYIFITAGITAICLVLNIGITSQIKK